jgi:hypothetical protein
MGMLAALGALPVALSSMHAGAWCDHGRKLSMLFASRLVAALALSTIALASWSCLLYVEWRCYVAVLVGTAKAFGGSTEQVLLSAIIGYDSIVEVHNHFTATGLAARLLDLGIAGLLVQLLATAWAPIAALVRQRAGPPGRLHRTAVPAGLRHLAVRPTLCRPVPAQHAQRLPQPGQFDDAPPDAGRRSTRRVAHQAGERFDIRAAQLCVAGASSLLTTGIRSRRCHARRLDAPGHATLPHSPSASR